MARFPIREAEIAGLADALAAGLAANEAMYPAPPIAPAVLAQTLGRYHAAREAVTAAAAEYQVALAAKNEVLEQLVREMKSDIRYAENTADGHGEKLKAIGWDARKGKTALAVPGQCGLLEVTRQGDSWLQLRWKRPFEGGKVAAYVILRRTRDSGSFVEVASALETAATLIDQPRGVEMEYQVAAINKAGSGLVSNTEMVVL